MPTATANRMQRGGRANFNLVFGLGDRRLSLILLWKI